MAASALEEKINKIKQQNEEIRRRYEEVEEDKKNAAKSNALVQMVPSTDWPERKEPPEFSNPPRASNKPPKPAKEHHEHSQQYHVASGEGRKTHTFAQGQGPPPDPKYNFLADSEREEGNTESIKDNPPNRGQKHSRGIFKRKVGGKDGMQRDYRTNRGPHRDEYQPEYEAWRAERNRIDEDRISRQRTAEGNWRREWDNDKAHIMNEGTRSEAKLGDYAKKDYDRRFHVNGNDYAHHNRGNHRSYRGNSKHFHSNYESRSNNAYHSDGHSKNPLSPGSDGRTVIATDKGIKVTLNPGSMTKGPVTSVKVNSPSIAGTGRVGPRQRSRITYSSHSDVEVTSGETDSFSRPKSFEDKSKGIYHDNLQKSPSARITQSQQKKKDVGNKSPYFRKKEIGREDISENMQKLHEIELRPEVRKDFEPKLVKHLEEGNAEPSHSDHTNVKQSDEIASGEPVAKDRKFDNCDNQSNDLSIQANVSKIHAETESDLALNLERPMPTSQAEMEMKVPDTVDTIEGELNETEVVQAADLTESKAVDLTTSATTDVDIDDNVKKETKLIADILCDINNDTEEAAVENKEQSSPMEQTEEVMLETEVITSDNCDKQNENTNEQENNIECIDTKDSLGEIEADNAKSSSPTDVCSVVEKDIKDSSGEKVADDTTSSSPTDVCSVVEKDTKNFSGEKIADNATGSSPADGCTIVEKDTKDSPGEQEANNATNLSTTEVCFAVEKDTKDSPGEKVADNTISSSSTEVCSVVEKDTTVSLNEKVADNATSLSPTDVCPVVEPKDTKSASDDEALKEEVTDDGVTDVTAKNAAEIETDDKQDTTVTCIDETCTNEIQERTVANDNEERKNDATNEAVVNQEKFPEGDSQVETEKSPNEAAKTEQNQ